VRVWYPTTVATNSWEIRKIIQEFLVDTADEGPDQDPSFRLHDFGARGVSSQETAMIGGASHLVSFSGSDTIAGVWCANKYYNVEMSGYSIPASEHSTMTMWGRDNEEGAYRNMVVAYGESPVFACVSDSYDVFNAVENLWGTALIDDVKNMKATLVVRPDSGDPVTVCLKIAQTLVQKFGTTTNTKGYKVINKVRIIQGDGVNAAVIRDVLHCFKSNGLSAANINFGSGGALLQKFHRDTCKFAFKCSWARIGDADMDVFKQPSTDLSKQSKKGRLDLVTVVRGGKTTYETVPLVGSAIASPNSALETVFENGLVLKECTFTEVRERALAHINNV